MHRYTIKSGDTLWALSKKFGTTIDALAKANGIENPNLIITGRALKIPGSQDSVEPSRASAPRSVDGNRPGRSGRGASPRPPTPPRQREPEVSGNVRLGEVPRGQAAQYEYFKNLVKAQGGAFKTGPNQFNLVGLRTNTPTTANGGNGSYDDRLAVVWKDAQGRPRVELLRYNTEPARNMSRYSADVNGDGRADQGRLTDGSYEFVKSSWKHGFCLRPVRDYRVQRDMNHNGRWDDSARTGGGGSMLFHSGGSSSTGSAGCQTFPPSEWARFQRLIGPARGSFAYTIVTR